MPKPLEPGRRIGKLTLIREVFPNHWICECECGKTVITLGRLLAKHKRRSCGCLYMIFFKEKLKYQMRARAMKRKY